MKSDQNIALLIDCDNVSHNSIAGVLSELAKYGIINIRRAYGNWKSKQLNRLGRKTASFCYKTYSTISIHTGKKCNRCGDDYRCHGFAV